MQEQYTIAALTVAVQGFVCVLCVAAYMISTNKFTKDYVELERKKSPNIVSVSQEMVHLAALFVNLRLSNELENVLWKRIKQARLEIQAQTTLDNLTGNNPNGINAILIQADRIEQAENYKIELQAAIQETMEQFEQRGFMPPIPDEILHQGLESMPEAE
jgi:hypothetical protein